MTNSQYSSGIELANALLSSDPLHQSWAAIDDQRLYRSRNPNPEPFLYISQTQQSNCTVVTFLTANIALQGKEGLVSSKALKDRNFPHFEFLCNKSTPSFLINKAAIDHFELHFAELDALRATISKSNSLVIITGHSLGGCVATLFTLFLLESLNLSKTKRPLCITFGSPLIGDDNLTKCISQFSTWNSCFLHTVSIQDPAPKVFISPRTTENGTISPANNYKPFGTFLLVSDSGCACFEDPDAILALVKTNSQSAQVQDPNVGIQFFNYGQILERLRTKTVCKDAFELAERDPNPLRDTILTQLAAIFGVLHSQALQQQQPNTDMNSLIKMLVTHERKMTIQKTKASNGSKKLIEMKKSMTQLEWYKKDAKRLEHGYYDMYKNKRNMSDINVEEYKKKLSNYWEDKVTMLENKPRKEGASLRTRYLFGGTNYRRMMEPLHIAEYYKEGGKDYLAQRPKHFKLLEQWLKEEKERKKQEKINKGEKIETSPSKSKANNVASSLTDDSRFWVHVEEALIVCDLFKNERTSLQDKEACMAKLKEFEGYVLDALKNFAVSPEIFLKHSTFMKWWEVYYKEIVGRNYSSSLADIMKHRTYREYEKGNPVVM